MNSYPPTSVFGSTGPKKLRLISGHQMPGAASDIGTAIHAAFLEGLDLIELADSRPLERQIERASTLPFAAPSALVMVQSTMPAPEGRNARKRWIAGTLDPLGRFIVDAGAARALAQGRSLLPAGVKSEDYVLDLIRAKGVVSTPGTGFGAAGEGFVRFTLCSDAEVLKQVAKILRGSI